ncbi:MAG: carboxylating nicotinate-nucleotide diphosphorylase [Psychroflexus sp.]|nr:carboxylating nicotinate-nucleotide diphosphorylase [Psychroflexus sp.]
MNKNTKSEVQRIIDNAIKEDIGDGDHSSLACIPEDARGKARLIIKEDGVLAGLEVAKQIFETVDPKLEIKEYHKDGDILKKGDIVFEVHGNQRSILKAERLVLNTLQRMCAIATNTWKLNEKIEDTSTKILDTRKTTPGIRLLEKMAVRIGGGVNHRFGLYDMIMLKDNHIDYAGSISNAIKHTKAYLEEQKKDLKIVVEARNLDEVDEILENEPVERILLDNFTPENTRKAVSRINGKCDTESSGNISIDTASNYARCGVDYISSGALTHHVDNIDMSLKAFD